MDINSWGIITSIPFLNASDCFLILELSLKSDIRIIYSFIFSLVTAISSPFAISGISISFPKYIVFITKYNPKSVTSPYYIYIYIFYINTL